VFYDREGPLSPCWRCERSSPPPLLEVGGVRLVLVEGAVLTNRHLRLEGDHEGAAGVVAAHPEISGGVTLRNLTGQAWTIRPEGGVPVVVKPGRRLGVRPMEIDFGALTGRVVVDP
jgi:hypothetical protein